MDLAPVHCAACGQPLEIASTTSGGMVDCPACGKQSQVPGEGPTQTDALSPEAPPEGTVPGTVSEVCAICCSPISHEEPKASCPNCRSHYHQECWQENGGCAVYGCSQAPTVEARRAIEIPVSYWGRENKPCPSCGREILAAAVRCRHCGATFASARPQDAGEFQQRTALEQRLPKVRKTVVWWFVLCLIPVTAPAGAVWGLVWYPSHREDLEALPSIYPALCKIGRGVAIIQTALLVVMGLLFSVLRQE